MTPGELLTSQVTAPAATVDEDIIIIVDVVEIIAAVAIVVEAPDEGTVVALPSVVVVVVEMVVVVVEVVVVEVVVEVAYSISVLVLLTLLQAASTHTQSVQPSVKSQLCSAGLSFTPQPRAVWLVAVSATENHNDLKLDINLQLGQLRLNPPGLGSKWVERFISDFGKYKGNVRNHTTSLLTTKAATDQINFENKMSCSSKSSDEIRS